MLEYKMHVSADLLDMAIAGDLDALSSAFVWDRTPQGHDYWEDQAKGYTMLDVDALTDIKRQCCAATRDQELTSPYGDNNHPLPDNKPKTWGEMTDAEKGALLLAKHEGKVIEVHDGDDEWVSCQGGFFHRLAYRVKPSPSHLPLTVGGMYELKNGETWECIFVRGDKAWMMHDSNPAYVFKAENGASISLESTWDVKGLAQ